MCFASASLAIWKLEVCDSLDLGKIRTYDFLCTVEVYKFSGKRKVQMVFAHPLRIPGGEVQPWSGPLVRFLHRGAWNQTVPMQGGCLRQFIPGIVGALQVLFVSLDGQPGISENGGPGQTS